MSGQNQTNHDTSSDGLNLDYLDQQIVKLLLTQPSITDTEIGKNLGISRQTVNKRRNSEAVKSKLCEVLAISEKRIRRLVALSLDQIEAFITDPDPRLRMASALAILKIGAALITPTPSRFDFNTDSEEKRNEWVKDGT